MRKAIGHSLCAISLVAVLLPSGAVAQDGDALISYNLGLAARAAGDEDAAYKHFREACLAMEGEPEACLEWGRMATARENDKDVKRAYSSVVMLAPDDIRGRYELALVLLEKEDWTWAIEHLEAAIPNATDPAEAALLRYYLGYAKLKSGALEEASAQFDLAARGGLEMGDAQRNDFYRGIVAEQLGKTKKAHAMFERATDGTSEEIAEAARARIAAGTAFPRLDGFGGQVSASFGYNSRPTADILDETMKLDFEAGPVLQSILRGDLLFGAGGYNHGFYGGLILYREQSWAQLGGDTAGAENTGEDMNLTMIMAQANYVGRVRKNVEHEVRLGLEGDVQLLDHQPEEIAGGVEVEGCDCPATYSLSDDVLSLFGVTVGPKLWWSMAPSESSIWSLRFKFEVRENKLTPDMSVTRLRFRLAQTQYFLDRTLQLKTVLGAFYDRAYKDDMVIKYDRIRPHLWLDVRWATPVPRLTALVGGKLKYNWYLNSEGNAKNSFRPTFVANDEFTAEQNAGFEEEYYGVTRHDFEWEFKVEAQVRLWSKAVLALFFYHHTRVSNLDDAPVPMVFNDAEGCGAVVESCEAKEYGYHQNEVMLELRQRF